VTLWWVGNALLLLALPVVRVKAFRIIRSLSGWPERPPPPALHAWG
jgi:hypothetical protein